MILYTFYLYTGQYHEAENFIIVKNHCLIMHLILFRLD